MSKTCILRVSCEYDTVKGEMFIEHPLMKGYLTIPCISEEAGNIMLTSISDACIEAVIAARTLNPVESIAGSVGEIKESLRVISDNFKK